MCHGIVHVYPAGSPPISIPYTQALLLHICNTTGEHGTPRALGPTTRPRVGPRVIRARLIDPAPQNGPIPTLEPLSVRPPSTIFVAWGAHG